MVKNTHAFTLVEIVVVISLMGILLFFAAPRMGGFLFQDDARKVSKWIVLHVADLKNKSVQTQKTFLLHVDLDGNLFRIEEAPDAASGDAAVMEQVLAETTAETSEKRFDLPQGYRVTSVLYSQDRRVSSGTTAVSFYPAGYSDRAIIHLTDRQNRKKSYIIEAFLPRVKIHDDHVQFF
jgi:prepilin-type N-terminal cleavage/methylation domain-containing protein